MLIILLILGFLIAFILSWIFDITPHGVVKTAPLDEMESDEETEVHSHRKLRRSDIIIVVLLGIVLVLLYPKIFGELMARSTNGPKIMHRPKIITGKLWA